MNVKKFTQERLLVEYQNKYFLLRVTIYKNRTKANLVIVKSQFFSFLFFSIFFANYFTNFKLLCIFRQPIWF